MILGFVIVVVLYFAMGFFAKRARTLVQRKNRQKLQMIKQLQREILAAEKRNEVRQ